MSEHAVSTSRRAWLTGSKGTAAPRVASAPLSAWTDLGPNDRAPPQAPNGLGLRNAALEARPRESEPSVDLRVPQPPFAVNVLGKMGFGPRPGDIEAFNALGSTDGARLQAYVEQQLAPSSLPDPVVDAALANPALTTLTKSLTALWTDHHLGDPPYLTRVKPMRDLECATLIRALHSRRQLQEVLADFWHNHFNVYGWEFVVAPVVVHYDRDVIRPHLFGNFRAMLEAVARSTAMMYYLDNVENTAAGPNENWARELLELHTLGAEHYYGVIAPDQVPRDPDGIPVGYVDNDVYEATRCFTGWSIRNGHWQFPSENDGTFVFRDTWHDRFSKYFLGLFLPANQGISDGQRVMDRLAAHPGTARHIARKLCRRLVGDNPSQSLVDQVANVFRTHWQAPDQLTRVYRTILLSAEFAQTWSGKVRRPVEQLVAGLRALGTSWYPVPPADWTWTVSQALLYTLQVAGQRPHNWAPPNGFPDRQSAWLGSGSLAMSWKLMAWLPNLREQFSTGNWLADVVTLTQNALPAAQRSATQIVDWWLARLYGYAGDAGRRQVYIDFLRQNASPTEALDLGTDAWNGSDLKRHYTQSRLRTTVAMMLCAPEFLRR